MTINENDASIIKGMLARGDKQQDIAAYFGENGGRISEINTGQRFPEVVAAFINLPPPGPLRKEMDNHNGNGEQPSFVRNDPPWMNAPQPPHPTPEMSASSEQKSKTRTQLRDERNIPWQEFNHYFSQLKNEMNFNDSQAMQFIGYGGAILDWQNRGAPKYARDAIRFHLGEIEKTKNHPSAPSFIGHNELRIMYGILINLPVSDTDKNSLAAKIAAEMSRADIK